ncbi:exostosin family protein, partial [candidate division WWE3 bacterium]|nr:exostosin family protein [candidate division WWE3 bacterium]
MIKVYYELIDGLRIVPLVYANHAGAGENFKDLPYRKKALDQIRERFVQKVENPEEADYLLIPHHSSHARRHPEYIKKLNHLANTLDKKILVFAFQDDAKPIDWPEAIIFRVSAYKSEMLENEFVLPYIVEDFSQEYAFSPKELPEVPSVGFVGYAGFDSVYQAVRSGTRELLLQVHSWATRWRPLGVKRKGLYLRKEMMRLLEQNDQIQANFVIRDRYSGHAGDLSEEDVKRVREEYVQNILESDITLSPRGEGNGSQRFYEVLSLGRIPLLIDTDNELPFEDRIPYERFVIRVPYQKRKEVSTYIENFFTGMTEEEYKKRQEE